MEKLNLQHMTIREIQQDIIDEFSLYDDWMDKYQIIIDMGKSLPLIADHYKTDDNLITGCQSQVWFHADLLDGKVVLTADSDAVITKGLAALMIRVFSNQPPQEIVAADLDFMEKIGLKQHLSPTRANGLLSMIKQIKYYALAFSQQKN